MAELATRYDGETIDHYRIRWMEDLTAKQRQVVSQELERERFHPEYRWVKVSDLYVDEAYQRPLSEEWVWDIATTFTWSRFQALWIGNRNNKLYIVDGRHRYAAASILGPDLVPEVPCEIRRTQNVEEEARLFVELTEKRRKMNSAQRFQAKLLYGDPVALDLERSMKRHGFKAQDPERFSSTISYRVNDEITRNVIGAIATLEHIHAVGGRQRVDAVLYILRKAWDGIAPTTSGPILRAINRLVERMPTKSVDVIGRKLGEKDPWGLIERGQRYGHANQIIVTEALAEVLVKVVEE